MTFEFGWTSAQESPAIAAGTQTATSGTVIFSNSNNVTFGMSNSSVVTASISGFGALSYWNNIIPGSTASFATGNSMSLFPLNVFEPFPGQMTVSTLLMNVSCSSSQSTAAGSLTFSLGVYTLNASTLSLLNSVSTSVTWGAVSNNSTAFSGLRWLSFHSSQWSSQPVFTQTNYWMGLAMSSSSQTQGFNLIGVGTFDANSNRFGTVGVSQGAAVSTAMAFPFFGTVATAALPSSIGQSQVVSGGFNGTVIPALIFDNRFGRF